jgi:5-methylcytosine-specific restriction enzyme subunit McrC
MAKLHIYNEHFEGEWANSEKLTLDAKKYQYAFPQKKDKEPRFCFQLLQKEETNYHLKLSYFIGVDWIDKEKTVPIYVQPKLNKESQKQTDYLKMLFEAMANAEVANQVKLDDLFEIKFDAKSIEIQQEQDLLTPLLIIQFLQVVKQIVRKGLKKSYYKVEQNLHSKVKGKVLVGQTIKQNIIKNRLLKTYCSYDEFGYNSLENRLLKKTLTFIKRYLPTLSMAKCKAYTTPVFDYISPAFESVSEEVSLYEVKQSKTNIFYKEYEQAIRLAKLILQRFGYNIHNTELKDRITTPPFWIDMSLVFEVYVLHLLVKKYGKGIVYQFDANYGNPDFLLLKPKVVIDAKYKPIYQQKDRYDIDDIRQISGYARDKKVVDELKSEPSKVIDCLIIYPQTYGGTDSNFNLEDNPIKQFVNFYKMAVKLPLIDE